MTTRKRKVLSKESQLRIFQRDNWLCCWCLRPVIFYPAMKYLQFTLREAGVDGPLAYYHAHGTRRDAPLLDELGACLDHVDAYSTGGACAEDNLCTACCKCNGRKSAASMDKWSQRERRKPISGKYGEPEFWDGFSRLFVVLANRNKSALNSNDRAWLKALKASKP